MLLKRLYMAFAGRSLWLRLDRKYDIDKGRRIALLMPEDDPELNEQALWHLDEMVAYHRAAGVVILTDKTWLLSHAKDASDSIQAVHRLSPTQIDKLLSLYELYEFTERMRIVSLHKPYKRQVHKVLGMNGITKEDVVCICIYGIHGWRPAEVVNG